MGEWSSIIGTTVQTLVILGSVGGFILRLHLDNKLMLEKHIQLVTRIVKVEDKMELLSDVLINMAKQETRLNNVDSRLQEISNRLYDQAKREGLSV